MVRESLFCDMHCLLQAQPHNLLGRDRNMLIKCKLLFLDASPGEQTLLAIWHNSTFLLHLIISMGKMGNKHDVLMGGDLKIALEQCGFVFSGNEEGCCHTLLKRHITKQLVCLPGRSHDINLIG